MEASERHSFPKATKLSQESVRFEYKPGLLVLQSASLVQLMNSGRSHFGVLS